jgi:hypothetical protein
MIVGEDGFDGQDTGRALAWLCSTNLSSLLLIFKRSRSAHPSG